MTLLNGLVKKKHQKRSVVIIESLEPRVLFSSDTFGGALNDTAIEDPLSRLLEDAAESFEQRRIEGEATDSVTTDKWDTSTPEYPLEEPEDTTTTAEYLFAPLAFEINQGQIDSEVDFMARGSGYQVYLTQGDAVLSFASGVGNHVVRLNIVGADSTDVLGGDRLSSTSNYMTGSNSDNWQTDVDQYASVEYQDVYDGIDLRYYGNQRQLEYDFIVDAGADASMIALNFDGIHSMNVADSGELVLTLTAGGEEIRFKAPYSYQEVDGQRQTVESSYVIHDDGTVGFSLGQYDSSRQLVIDPILDYGTFLGGVGVNSATDIAVDAAGNSYVVGQTQSGDFPTTVGPQGPTGNLDAFVTKLSADGSTIIWSTTIGGTKNDDAYSVAVDGGGNVYVFGSTKSDDFATVNAFDTTLNGVIDAFMLELNPAGNTLLYSTYFGGDGNSDTKEGGGIAVDTSGYVYIGGNVNDSINFTTTAGVVDSTYGGSNEAYVAKFDPTQSGSASLIYSTYLGGSGRDEVSDIAVDGAGNIVVTGTTNSVDFPVTPATAYAQVNGGGGDVFVTRLNPTGDTLLYSTYLGGDSSDVGAAVVLDSAGIIYITGYTDNSGITDYPTTAGAYQTLPGGAEDVIISVIDPTQSGNNSLIYSTFLGGSANDQGTAIAVDSNGRIYVTGYTRSTDFPTTGNALDSTRGGSGNGPTVTDAFISIINPGGGGNADLLYSSYLGGDNDVDIGYGIAIDSADNVYVVGETSSADFGTTAGAYDETSNGDSDAFVVKFSGLVSTSTPPTITLPGGALNYTEGDGSVVIDAAATAADPDSADFDTATLTVDFTVNSTINDQLSIRDQGAGVGNIQLSGNSISYDSGAGAIVIGTFVGGGDGSTPLAIILNTNADVVVVQALMRNIIYTNNSADPSTLSRTLRVVLTDGDGGTSNTVTKSINLTAVNNPPTVAVNTGTTVLEGSTANTITTAMLNKGDVDDSGTELTYAITSVTANGALRLNGTALGINDTFTQDDIDNNRVTYDHDDSETVSDSFDFSLADGGEDGATAATGTFNIIVTLVDESPLINDINVGLDENSVNTAPVVNLNDASTGNDLDADGQALTYSITAGNGSGAFTINGATGEITVFDTSQLDYESVSSFVLTVEASDGMNTDSAAVTVNLNNLNDNNPLINDVTVGFDENSVNTTPVIDLSDANTGNDLDADGQALTYSITAGNGSGAFTINGSTGEISVLDSAQLDYESVTSFVLSVEASDGTNTDSAAVTVNLNNLSENNPLINDVTVGLDENSVNTTPVIDLSDANTGNDLDADGEALTYSITGGNGSGAFTINAATGEITVLDSTHLDYESVTSFVLSVEASDGTNTDSAAVTVNLNNLSENNPLINDVAVNLDENSANSTPVVNLNDASTGNDTDADGQALTYSITAGNGSGAFTINGATGAITVADSSQLDYESLTGFVLTVMASDGTNSDTAAVTINLNNLTDNNPLINDVTVGLDENSVNTAPVVNLNDAGTGNDLDADGQALTYSITAGNGSGAFTINGATGAITVADSSQLDYESLTSFVLTVMASDGTNSDTAAVTINLNNLTDNDPLINDVAVNLDENSANTAPVVNLNDANTGNDLDADGEALTYSITAGNGSGAFTINGATGEITVFDASQLDYESVTSFVLTVEASDGTNSDSAAVTVNLNNLTDNNPLINNVTVGLDENSVNTAPVVNLNDASTGNDLDADGQALTYSITAGNGSGAFTINGATGEITVFDASQLDYESLSSFVLSVEASDGMNTDSAAVTVNLNNLNDNNPLINDVTVGLDENSVNTAPVVNLNDASTGNDLDADGQALTYSITAGNGSGAFTINGATGEISVLDSAQLDYESVTSFVLSVEASDGTNSDSAAVTVNLNNLTDNNPLINNVTVGLDENSVNTAPVVNLNDASTGNDLDADGQALTYSITAGNGSGAFTINGATGEITVADSSQLDYESVTSFVLTVEASGGSNTDSAAVTINLNNLSDNSPLIIDVIGNPDNGSTGNDADANAIADTDTDTDTDTDGIENEEVEPTKDEPTEKETLSEATSGMDEIPAEEKPDVIAAITDEIVALLPIDGDILAYVVADAQHYIDPDESLAETNTPIPNKFIDLRNLDIASFALGSKEPLNVRPMMNSISFAAELETMNKELDQAIESGNTNHRAEAQMVTGVAMTLTTGVVSWVLKTGSLMASFLSSAPAWKQFDPLPILAEAKAKTLPVQGKHKNTNDEKDANVEELFKRDVSE